MSEMSVTTTDNSFVEEGVRAESRSTMAFDSTEHIQEIVVTVLGSGLIIATR